jgi:protein SCO1
MRLAHLFLLAAILAAFPAAARVLPIDYQDAGVVLPDDASLPLAVSVTNSSGRQIPLGDLISHPTVLIFADYTCRTLCGPTIAFVASALEKSGLRPGSQFHLLVIGLDPKDSMADAAKMRRAHIGAGTPLDRATEFVTASPAAVRQLAAALGYRYHYDVDSDVYIHPAAAYVLRSDGRVSRVLTGIGLSGADMRLAIVEASAGKIGTLGDQVRLLCSAFDPAHGTYDLRISRVLEIAGLVTVAVLAGGIGLLLLTDRRRAA